MSKRETCECGRPRYTAADLKRWEALTTHERTPDPPWSRELCWTKPGLRCPLARATNGENDMTDIDRDLKIDALWFDKDGAGPDHFRLQFHPFTAEMDGRIPAALGIRIRAGEMVCIGAVMIDSGFKLDRSSVAALHAELGKWLGSPENVITFTHDSANSPAANRFYLPSNAPIYNEKSAQAEIDMLRAELAEHYPIAITARAFMNDEATEDQLREVSDDVGNGDLAHRLTYLPKRLGGTRG